MSSVKAQLKSLEDEKNERIRRIESAFAKKRKKLTSGLVRCTDMRPTHYSLHLGKRGKMLRRKYGEQKSCDEWYDPKTCALVEIEDYHTITTYTDAGYGDDDTHAMAHFRSRYEVCPHCGALHQTDHEELERGPDSTRWENVPGFDIRPSNWYQNYPEGKITVIRKEKK